MNHRNFEARKRFAFRYDRLGGGVTSDAQKVVPRCQYFGDADHAAEWLDQ